DAAAAEESGRVNGARTKEQVLRRDFDVVRPPVQGLNEPTLARPTKTDRPGLRQQSPARLEKARDIGFRHGLPLARTVGEITKPARHLEGLPTQLRRAIVEL